MKLKDKIGIGCLFYFAIAFIVSSIGMGWKGIPMVIIGLVFGYFAFRVIKWKQAEAEEQEEEETLEQMPPSPALHQSSPSGPNATIRLVAYDEEDEEEDEETTFSIKGINYANIDDSYLGDHDGYIKAETDNPKDEYAISVHVGRKRVGWLPAGNKKLHEDLLTIGGKAKVDITISKAYDKKQNRYFYCGKAVIPKQG